MEQKYGAFTQQILVAIEQNLQHKNCLKQLEATFLKEHPNFAQHFEQEVGRTLEEYIIKQRLKQSEKLLEQKELSVKDISKAIGFNGYFEFTQLFKRFNGISPVSYRTQMLKGI